MPTPLPPLEKSNFIDIVRAFSAYEADRLLSVLNNYEDVYTAIMRQLYVFAAENAYLTEAISVFTLASLNAVGIWVGATATSPPLSPPLSDPVLIINSPSFTGGVYITTTVSSPPIYRALVILGDSRIDSITLDADTTLSELFIGPGSTVDLLDSTQSLAITGTVYLPFLKSTASSLKAAKFGSIINSFVKDPRSYFGGFTDEDPSAACALAVSSLTISLITANNATLAWVPNMGGWLFINVYYRISGSNDWIQATTETGIFKDDTGYTFTNLKEDTNYEFMVQVICNNGGRSAEVTVTGKTECC